MYSRKQISNIPIYMTYRDALVKAASAEFDIDMLAKSSSESGKSSSSLSLHVEPLTYRPGKLTGAISGALAGGVGGDKFVRWAYGK